MEPPDAFLCGDAAGGVVGLVRGALGCATVGRLVIDDLSVGPEAADAAKARAAAIESLLQLIQDDPRLGLLLGGRCGSRKRAPAASRRGGARGGGRGRRRLVCHRS